MSESDKIRIVMKGIDDDVFTMLLAKNPRTVAEVKTLCQSYEDLCRPLSMTGRLPSLDAYLSALSTVSDHSAFIAEVKIFVRKEVAHEFSLLAFGQPQYVHQSSATILPPLRQVIQQEITEVIPEYHHHPPAPAALTYAPVVATPSHAIPSTAPLSYAEVAAIPQTFETACRLHTPWSS